MKTPPASLHSRGAALVTVLGLMVVILGLAVTFLTRTNVENQSSTSYAAGASGRQLADIAVNLVQAQIQQATTQGSAVAWASQPGMIRTFTNTSGGPIIQAYKLYSDTDLILNSPTTAQLTTGLATPTAWISSPASWTDLNSPVVANGTANYPILNPLAAGTVEGFTINAPPGAGTTPGQMPVRWLYVLQDGALVAPTGSGNTATVAGSSRANPIVGRVAFWTDDETCKVNINTASEGGFWDTPRVTTREDMITLAKNQPAQGEFQRYPGHPAATSLAPVLFATSATDTPDLTDAQREAIYAMTPRVSGGGSQGGTVVPSGALSTDNDRLFATVDEMIFNVSRNQQVAAAGLSRDKLDRARFFLTANSRAPEVTLFNTPRVALWPIDSNATRRTAYDRLIAFCSTVAGYAYYFQRSDPKSATADFSGILRNQQLYSYLQQLTRQNIPGFGSNFEAKFGAANRNQLLTQIFDYIRSTNLDDTQLSEADRFGVRARYAAGTGVTAGFGQVTPIRIGATQGFGRFPSISEVGIHLIAVADGSGFEISGARPTLLQCGNIDAIKKANDAKLDSNDNAKPNKTLGGVILKGEPYLDIGYGPSNTGRNNNKFDWDDATLVAGFPGWQNNGHCDFEPWDDLNQDGIWNVGEPWWDANDNGAHDKESHEPLHDWGRNNKTKPPFPDPADPSLWAAKSPNWSTAQWDSFVNGRSADTQINGRYNPADLRIEAMVFFEINIPSQGWPAIHPAYTMRVRGLNNFAVNGVNLGFPADEYDLSDGRSGSITHGRNWGGTLSHRTQLYFARLPARGPLPADAGSNAFNSYRYVGVPVTIDGTGTMSFSGGQITVDLYAGRNNESSPSAGFPSANTPVQSYTFDFPAGTFPMPNLVATGTVSGTVSGTGGSTSDTVKENWWTFSRDGNGLTTNTAPGMTNGFGRIATIQADPGSTGTVRAGAPFRNEDVVRTLVPSREWADTRLVAASPVVPASAFVPHPSYNDVTQRLAHAISESAGSSFILGAMNDTQSLVSSIAYKNDRFPDVPIANTNSENFGDWDNGVSVTVDGAYINMPDEGNIHGITNNRIPYYDEAHATAIMGATFFSPNRLMPSAGMLGSLPVNIPSVNLATGAISAPGVPFRTLLFRPQSNHPGSTNSPPADHLLTDLFWMPVVEPYAISEPFSTAGKINMNYEIAPFGSFITRSTGVVSLLRSERILAIPDARAGVYKNSAGIKSLPSWNSARLAIDAQETLSQFRSVFAGGDLFRSPSQIMSLHLVPQGQTVAGMPNFWSSHRLTGDNSRERPYTNLLGRLTTKSNVYTVHYKVQALKPTPASSTAGTWDETRDRVLSEQRGSTTLERYINPNDPTIIDYATATFPLSAGQDLGAKYKWRVLSNTSFAP